MSELLSGDDLELLTKVFSHPERIPKEFWKAVKSKMEADAPALLASDVVGSQRKIQVVATLSGLGSPTNGDQVIYRPSSGISWHLVYNSAAATYKWEYVGGPPLTDGPQGTMSTTSTSYVDLTTGPTIVIPRSGEYLIEHGGFAQNTTFTTAYDAMIIVLGTTSGGGTVASNVHTSVFQGGNISTITLMAAVSGETFKIQVRGNTTHTSTFRDGWIKITPIRLS